MQPLCTTIDHTSTFIRKSPEIRGKDRGGDDCAGHDAFQVGGDVSGKLGIAKVTILYAVRSTQTEGYEYSKGLWRSCGKRLVIGAPAARHVRTIAI